MKQSVSPKIVSITFGILIIIFLTVFYVVAWQEPTQAPPGGNVSAPLNVGPTGQSKTGGLILNTGGAPTGLIVATGTVQIGGAMIFSAISQPALSSPNQVTMYYDPSSQDLKVSINGQSYVSLLRGAGAPFPITALTATPGDTQVILNWSNPSDGGSAITNYKVYRSATSGAETLFTTLGNVLTYTNTSLTNGTIYYYKVTAVNGVGEGTLSTPPATEVNTIPATIPGTPTWQVTPLVVGNTQITVQWVAPASNGGSALTGFRVYRSSDNVTYTEIISGACANSILNGSSTSCVNTGLTNGTAAYYYKIQAVNAVGNGPQSSAQGVVPFDPLTWPSSTHRETECTTGGGTVVSDGSYTFCKYALASCPPAWTQSANWHRYNPATWGPTDACGRWVSNGPATFANAGATAYWAPGFAQYWYGQNCCAAYGVYNWIYNVTNCEMGNGVGSGAAGTTNRVEIGCY